MTSTLVSNFAIPTVSTYAPSPIRAYFDLVTAGQPGHELSILPGRQTAYIGSDFLDDWLHVQDRNANFYLTLNPGERSVGAPAYTDESIAHLRTMLIDIDAKRDPSKTTPATDAQNEHAMATGHKCIELLASIGITALCISNSGNGCAILVRLDMDTSKVTRVAGFLNWLAIRLDNEHSEVDTGCFNASRLTRLIGTTNNKREPNEQGDVCRPSFLVEQFENPTVVTDLSQWQAPPKPKPKPKVDEQTGECTHTGRKRMYAPGNFEDFVKVLTDAGQSIIKRSPLRGSDDFDKLAEDANELQFIVIAGCAVTHRVP